LKFQIWTLLHAQTQMSDILQSCPYMLFCTTWRQTRGEKQARDNFSVTPLCTGFALHCTGFALLYWVCLTLYSSVVIVNISAKLSASMHMGNEIEPTMWTHLSCTQVCSEEIHWCTRHAGMLLCHAQYSLECLVQPTRAPDNPAQTTIEVYHAPYSHYICRRGPTDRSISAAHFGLLLEQATMQGNSLSVSWAHQGTVAMVIFAVWPAPVSKPAKAPHPSAVMVQAVRCSWPDKA